MEYTKRCQRQSNNTLLSQELFILFFYLDVRHFINTMRIMHDMLFVDISRKFGEVQLCSFELYLLQLILIEVSNIVHFNQVAVPLCSMAGNYLP